MSWLSSYGETRRQEYTQGAWMAAHLRQDHGYTWKKIGEIFNRDVTKGSDWRNLVDMHVERLSD